VVDVREFRSSLPSFLHASKMHIDAVTLTVGDFVLSPSLCVERKSISDLFQSLKSGRLFNQAEAMTRYYRTPILLIEFSAEKAFFLQNRADIKEQIDLNSICSKLTLLTTAFPNLRLVWSRDARHTVELFQALKRGQAEPDLKHAMAAGAAEDYADDFDFSAAVASAASASASSSEASAAAVLMTSSSASSSSSAAAALQASEELLLRLPGVTVHNYRRVMKGCGSLAELCQVSEKDLAGLLGSTQEAKALHRFLNQPAPV